MSLTKSWAYAHTTTKSLINSPSRSAKSELSSEHVLHHHPITHEAVKRCLKVAGLFEKVTNPRKPVTCYWGKEENAVTRSHRSSHQPKNAQTSEKVKKTAGSVAVFA